MVVSFSAGEPGNLVAITFRATYKQIFEENLLQSAIRLHLGQKYMLQQDNAPKYRAETIKKWLEEKKKKRLVF